MIYFNSCPSLLTWAKVNDIFWQQVSQKFYQKKEVVQLLLFSESFLAYFAWKIVYLENKRHLKTEAGEEIIYIVTLFDAKKGFSSLNVQ